MGSLTDMWTNWVEEASAKTQRDEDLSDPFALPLKVFERSCLPKMKEQGYCMPTRRTLRSTLESGLEALPVETNFCNRHESVTMCTLWHFLNLLWQPICTFIEDLFKGKTPTWSSELDMNHKALLVEMQGNVSAPDDSLTQDEWHMFIHKTLNDLVSIDVTLELIQAVLAPIAPLDLACTRANAYHVLMSNACCSRLVGPTLAALVRREVLALVSDLSVPLPNDEEMNNGLKSDVVALLTEAHCRPVPEPDEALSTPSKKKSRTLEARESLLADKTKQVLWVLENRLAPTRSNATLRSGIELLKSLGAQTDELQDAMDTLVGKNAQFLHILLLDGALDRWVGEMIFQKRGEGCFAGFGFASDESPPSQPRVRGLRFQITVMYIGTFAPSRSMGVNGGPAFALAPP